MVKNYKILKFIIKKSDDKGETSFNLLLYYILRGYYKESKLFKNISIKECTELKIIEENFYHSIIKANYKVNYIV